MRFNFRCILLSSKVPGELMGWELVSRPSSSSSSASTLWNDIFSEAT